MESIPFVVAVPDTDDEQVKGLFNSDEETGLVSLPVDKLKANLTKACNTLTGALADLRAVGAFRLSEVTVQVEISAEAGVQFIGTGKAGGKGAITLTFKEKHAET